VNAIPTTFIVDRNGILAQTNVGFLDEAVIKRLLDQPAAPDTPAADTAAANAPADTAPTAGASGATPATPSNPAPPDAGEKQAESLLTMANNYLAIKRPDKAAEKLNQLIAKYPNTKAAAKAREMLAQIK
jgi:hypothetical protein